MMIVNFAVKQQGLEAQLLSTVVKQERADLDRQKNELVVKVAQGKRTQASSTLASYPPHQCCCLVRKTVYSRVLMAVSVQVRVNLCQAYLVPTSWPH